MLDNDIRLKAIGQIERLPADVRDAIADAMAATAGERCPAAQSGPELRRPGRNRTAWFAADLPPRSAPADLDPPTITEQVVADHLYTRDMPDPDLLIRTSGEMRISNFLLWQIAYAEIYVTHTLWPDFGGEEFLHILDDYQNRERRFGAWT